MVTQGPAHCLEPVRADDVVGIGQRETAAPAGGDSGVARVVQARSLRRGDEPELRMRGRMGGDDRGSRVGGAVVDDDDFVGPIPRLPGERGELVAQNRRFVVGRDDDGELDVVELRVVRRFAGHESVLRARGTEIRCGSAAYSSDP